MQCLRIAVENPPAGGEYRVFNQFQEVYDLTELAELVQSAARETGREVEIGHLENPRKELEEHFYQPDHHHLADLGYKPTTDVRAEIGTMLADLAPHRDRIQAHRDVLIPDVRWDGRRERVSFQDEGVSVR
jgi:UDP-sulfoquinovose synthase